MCVIDFKCSNEEEKLINVATDNYETNNLTILWNKKLRQSNEELKGKSTELVYNITHHFEPLERGKYLPLVMLVLTRTSTSGLDPPLVSFELRPFFIQTLKP